VYNAIQLIFIRTLGRVTCARTASLISRLINIGASQLVADDEDTMLEESERLRNDERFRVSIIEGCIAVCLT